MIKTVDQETIEYLQKENENLKAALDTLSVRHAELVDERNQLLMRRAALSKKYEALREKLQMKASKKIEQNPYGLEDRLQDFDED
jgi:alanyl-tRNA synthetase